jgi:hypothetical protein
MTKHQSEPIELKCWSVSFQALKNGTKRFEFRKDDRPYDVGVTLLEREWNPDTGYTGDELYHDVTFIIRGGVFGIPDGYCIMSVSEPRFCATIGSAQSELEITENVLDEVIEKMDLLEYAKDPTVGAVVPFSSVIKTLEELRSKQGEHG